MIKRLPEPDKQVAGKDENTRIIERAVAKVLRDPKLSKTAMVAAGLDITQSPYRRKTLRYVK